MQCICFRLRYLAGQACPPTPPCRCEARRHDPCEREWTERMDGHNGLPPWRDYWVRGRIVGCIEPSRNGPGIEWTPYAASPTRPLSGPRANRDDAERVVEEEFAHPPSAA